MKKNTVKKSKAMDLYATRLPKQEGRFLKRIARKEKRTISNLLRTAWKEYILVHYTEA